MTDTHTHTHTHGPTRLTSQHVPNTKAGLIPDCDCGMLNPRVQSGAVDWRHELMCQWNSSSRPWKLSAATPALNTPTRAASRAHVIHCSKVFACSVKVVRLKWPWCCRSCTVWDLLHTVHPQGSCDTEEIHWVYRTQQVYLAHQHQSRLFKNRWRFNFRSTVHLDVTVVKINTCKCLIIFHANTLLKVSLSFFPLSRVTLQVTAGLYLVMQVRVLTEAPPPQLREQTDQPLHGAHSFRKCSCRRTRAGRPAEDSAEGPHAETQDWNTNDRERRSENPCSDWEKRKCSLFFILFTNFSYFCPLTMFSKHHQTLHDNVCGSRGRK